MLGFFWTETALSVFNIGHVLNMVLEVPGPPLVFWSPPKLCTLPPLRKNLYVPLHYCFSGEKLELDLRYCIMKVMLNIVLLKYNSDANCDYLTLLLGSN